MISQKTDLLVVGESAGGIVASVCAAREGLNVALVTYERNLGGVMPSLGAIETHYPGVRTPMLTEIRDRIIDHYRTTYGEDSPQFKTCVSLESGNPMVTYEPHVLENIFTEMINDAGVQVFWRYRPVAVQRCGREIQRVRFQSFEDQSTLEIEASTFIDTTYEGDLMACAGVAFRYGRESRDDYGEPHAGRIFTRWDFSGQKYPLEAAAGKLNIIPKFSTLGIYSGSTGEGDDRVQSYSYRLCITNQPENRHIPADPPPGYRREDYAAITMSPEEIGAQPYALHHRFLNNTLRGMIAQDQLFHGHQLPNGKRSWNATNFPGGNRDYLSADHPTRQQIALKHLHHALGILYFLQHDESVPEDIRASALEWGLAKDEFTSNSLIPPQLYVREGRRMFGRTTFTEFDNMVAPGTRRSPVHSDAIGITEFPIDSLACSTDRMLGTLNDGQFFLMELSRPGQIPWRVMIPEDIDNLLVPVATSTSHVAWGTVRQTPTLIHISESAAIAAVCAKESGSVVGKLDVERLQRALVRRGVMLSFFNDFDMSTDGGWVAAVQYFGTKGFFSDYEAHPEAALDVRTARQWALAIVQMMTNTLDAAQNARFVAGIQPDETTVSTDDLRTMIREAAHQAGITVDWPVSGAEEDTVSRGDACQLLFDLLGAVDASRHT